MPTGRAVEITRTELSAAELRRAAARSRDADAARRMLALALVLEGKSRKEAAESCGMDRQTLRDWVIRYNDKGLPGVADRGPAGAALRGAPGDWPADSGGRRHALQRQGSAGVGGPGAARASLSPRAGADGRTGHLGR